jgi:hypothetical protein
MSVGEPAARKNVSKGVGKVLGQVVIWCVLGLIGKIGHLLRRNDA